MRLELRLLVSLIFLLRGIECAAAERPQPELVVFAAASLTDVLEEIGGAYTRATGHAVKFSFAASSALARQIEAGSRADVFFPADTEWMDYLDSHQLIDRSTRRDILGNRLVLIAPTDSALELRIVPGLPLAAALGKGRLVTGDPDSVPAGRYARSALIFLGVWDRIADRLVYAENVRSALAFVARGETPLGIVYETDALVEKRVRIVGVFPANSHPPVRYPAAAITAAQPGARRFIDFLRAPASRAIFTRHGFRALP